MPIGNQDQFEKALSTFSTPFDSITTASQNLQFAIDPSRGLSKLRYNWHSNGELFDSTFFTESPEGIRLETGSGADDIARIHSSYAGQYISQSLAKPGIGAFVPSGNSELDSDNRVSLQHGAVYVGAFWWDSAANEVRTGIGYVWDTDGWRFFVKSNGDHIGNSPIPQSEFTEDSFDGTGRSGQIHDPPIGYVYNFPYTWYNEGPFEAGYLSKVQNRYEASTLLSVEGPSTETPNFPVQMVVYNDGDTEPTTAELGGMQYSTYGAGRSAVPFRETDESRFTPSGYIDSQYSTTENAIDPRASVGRPLISIQRQDGERDLNIKLQEIVAQVFDDDVYLYQWDEFDPESTLTGASFSIPNSSNGLESRILTDTQATDYTPDPQTSLFRNYRRFIGGQSNNKAAASSQNVDVRLSIDATRVITAVNEDGTSASMEPIICRIEEGF